MSKLPEAVLKASLALVRGSSDSSAPTKSDADELCALQAKNAHRRLLQKAEECGQKGKITSSLGACVEAFSSSPDAVTAIASEALGELLPKLPAGVLTSLAQALDAPQCGASQLPAAVEDELLLQGAREVLSELDSAQLKDWVSGTRTLVHAPLDDRMQRWD